jgi:hypothetical protein
MSTIDLIRPRRFAVMADPARGSHGRPHGGTLHRLADRPSNNRCRQPHHRTMAANDVWLHTRMAALNVRRLTWSPTPAAGHRLTHPGGVPSTPPSPSPHPGTQVRHQPALFRAVLVS